MAELFESATSEKQYDKEEIAWSDTDWLNNIHSFQLEYISRDNSWKSKKVLDIGCGTGWLLEHALKEGATIAEGIEPSEKNYRLIQRNRPELVVFNDSFQSFETTRKYDLIISIMAFNHLSNIDEAFKKSYQLLESKGKLIILVPEFEWSRRKRLDYDVEIETISDDEYVVKTKRTIGNIADIIRKPSVYISVATKAGLHLMENTGMRPTPKLIESEKKYLTYKDIDISRMIIFQK